MLTLDTLLAYYIYLKNRYTGWSLEKWKIWRSDEMRCIKCVTLKDHWMENQVKVILHRQQSHLWLKWCGVALFKYGQGGIQFIDSSMNSKYFRDIIKHRIFSEAKTSSILLTEYYNNIRHHVMGVYLSFVDYAKAFDGRYSFKAMEHDERHGLSRTYYQLAESLYENQESTVRTNVGTTDWFKVTKGVRQGCCLSPQLFNIYTEQIMRNVLEEDSYDAVSIGERAISELRYVDDTVLLSTSE